MQNTLLLVDAYAAIYRAYYAFIKSPRVNSQGQNTSAIYGFVVTLNELIKTLHPTHIAVAFDPKGKTFRHEQYPQYKAQRPPTPEDIHRSVPIIKDILSAMNITVLEQEGFEADDVIGTMATRAEQQGYEVYMATPDKDYGQLVTDHVFMYRPRHTGGYEKMGPQEVCHKYGLRNQAQVIDLLALMGDSSDNIPGCPGVGEKTATRLLIEYGSVDNILANTTQLRGSLQAKLVDNREQILFSRFLATIRTDVPIDCKISSLTLLTPDYARLIPIYQQLEFRTLLRQLPENARLNADAETKLSSAEGNLFSQPQTEPLQPLSFAAKNGLPAVTDRLVFVLNSTKKHTQFDLFSAEEKEVITLTMQGDDEEVWICELNDDNSPTCLNEQIVAWLQDENIEKVGYNLKPTYKLLLEKGILLRGALYDIQVAHYLLQPELSHELAALTETYLHRSLVDNTASEVAAMKMLRASMPQPNTLLLQTEMALIPVLANMERAGVRFDRKILGETSQKMHTELSDIETAIYQMAGTTFNINSPKQLGEVLFDRLHLDDKAKKTKSGQYTTSEEVLLTIRERHPIIDKILDYRELKKLLTTYIDALPDTINPITGKVHTTYNQTVTATGRLSSSNPNLQNLPIRSDRGRDIRRAVIADPHCLFLSADYSQIELRLMAHFSGDEHMIAAFRQGQDIHAATAAKIFNVPIEEVTSDMRRRAKTANFGIIYGISAFGLAQQLGSSRTDAKQLIDDYFLSFPRIIQFIDNQKRLAREQGYVETMFSRRRYLPDINSRNPTVRSFAERNAVNAPIQGTAADIIKMAMVNIARRIKEENLTAQMIMQVHDELCFNVPENEVERVRQIVVGEMESVVNISVPLIAECGVAQNWLDAH